MSEGARDDEGNTENANTKERLQYAVTVRTPSLTTSTSQFAVARTSRKGPLISLTPMERRLVMSAGRAATNIADGLFLSSTVVNPVVTVAFVFYDSFRAVSDYHRGKLNTLGYSTSLADVTLNVGKTVGSAAIGVAIGHGVGTVIALSSIPVAGQIVTATLLSFSLGVCIGTLLTRYADRLFIRLRLQAQYEYSPDEQKARERFEQLLDTQHDLSSFEACRIVQHYRDYRVACGWESYTDVDDYRASANLSLMPVSFQHFAIVQLQRKWGFLNRRGECRKVYKALMLLHHPDKGGDNELATQLNHDYEVYAFCQGWQEDCSTVYQNETDEKKGNKPTVSKKRRKNTVVNFLRSLFRPMSNSLLGAEDLLQNGLMALEAGTPPELQRFDKGKWKTVDDDDDDDDDDARQYDNSALGSSALVQQRSVSRVLASIRRCYELATEAITFAGLVRLYKEKEQWLQLERDVFVFNRLQTFLNVVDDIAMVKNDHGDLSVERCCYGVRWRTKEEAVARREEKRVAIVSCCFPPHVSSLLMKACDLWETAKSLAESFFRHSSSNDGGGINSKNINGSSTHNYEGTGQTLDTLLNIQKALQEITDSSTQSWMNSELIVEESLDPQFMEKVRALGLTASFALAGAYAGSAYNRLWENCMEFWNTRQRKLETVTSLLNEIHDLRLRLTSARTEEQKELQMQHDDFMKQLFLIHYVFAEVDIAVAELYDVCTMHLPEKSDVLKALPSSCSRCVYESLQMPRFVRYERERTLMNYMNVEVEPRNAMDPFESLATQENMLESDLKVEFALLRAKYVDPVNGAVTSCWIKRYTFPKTQGTEAQCCAAALFEGIMEHELRISKSCATHRVTCVTDVFCDECTRELFFHIPRGGTQLRFGSTHDIRKRVLPIGFRWLHDALQCLIDLHSCQLVHGAVCLSNFTYDDFGNTSLGFFFTAVRDRVRDVLTPLDDTINFGAMLRAEVLPYLLCPSPVATPAQLLPVVAKREENFLADGQRPHDEIIHVFREVADRLIGNVEPRWSLLDARAFVRRFLEFRYDSDERNYLFTKEVSYPAYWAVQKSIMPVSLVAERRLFSELHQGVNVFLSRNAHLWEIYWRCRREMVQKRGGGFFSMPAMLRRQVPFLPCGDDCEVNERFLWYTCVDEEEAWRICLEGVTAKSCRLCLIPPWMKQVRDGCHYNRRNLTPTWGVVFRVSLGTVVETDRNTLGGLTDYENVTEPFDEPFLANNLERSAEQHCALISGRVGTNNPIGFEVVVPSPGARCYPEYIVHQPRD